jgi:thymidylate synthase
MHLTFRNVNDAFLGLVKGIFEGTIPTTTMASRNGEVQVVEEPVIITYEKPMEKVLFNQARDANPFFHLYEALWMLAGRNDVAPLAYYNKKIAQYSDNGETFNGAYGYRWRHASAHMSEVNQLEILIQHLRKKPESRRAVLQMWNVGDDLIMINASKDVCCNLSVCFSIELGTCRKCKGEGRIYDPTGGYWTKCFGCHSQPEEQPHYLNMTVFNRSNDAIWGMLGANAVHFAFLQEYVAANLGLEVGRYHQITSNLHVYSNNWKPEEWLKEESTDRSYPTGIPLVHDCRVFEEELFRFVEHNKDGELLNGKEVWEEPFLNDVAQPMCHAFYMQKNRDHPAAYEWLRRVKADDWRRVGMKWLRRRVDARARKEREKNLIRREVEGYDPDLMV